MADDLVVEETQLENGMFRWALPDFELPRNLTAPEKIALDQKLTVLAEKAEQRQLGCWTGCGRKASVWVREVSFDFKNEKAEPIQHTAVSSADYDGPVPGFCIFCLGTGPQDLAQTVYFSRPEMYWGVRPNRWFVSFTDDTKQGGLCIEINPKQEFPTIVEEHINNG